MYILEIPCRGSTVAELSKLTYVEDKIIIPPLFLCTSLNFLKKKQWFYILSLRLCCYTVKTLYNIIRYNRIFNIRHKIAGNGSVSIKIHSL